MLLSAGKRLGVYEISEQIGAGGMGEVYRARDTKLGRDVALKVLPAALAEDSHYMARFQHEAHVLASLSHPNIASIHGLEESGDTSALVMELVDGPTLADRIKAGPVRLEEALNIAKQIAEALEYAHEKGIIHRDLKPANVKLTSDGTVKLLDFGLAKAAERTAEDRQWESAPTVQVSLTHPGMIVGSAGYMAPEQARGVAADKRADIWAFGVVLLEMLTGKRTFTGATVGEMLEAVQTKDPDWNRLPAATPAPVRRLLERCLQRDRKRRLQAIGDARIEIEEYLGNPASVEERVNRRGALPWVAAALVAIAFLVGWLLYFRKPPPDGPVLRYSLPPHDKLAVLHVAPSPDGRLLAFVTQDFANRYQLWVRRLDSVTDQLLPGTDGAYYPFWSPDSRFLGFFAGDKLKKIDIGASSAPEIVSDAGCCGATWSRDGVILSGSHDGRIFRVSASGRKAIPVTTLDPTRQEHWHICPWFLPDGRHFLYTVRSGKPENSGIYVGTLDSADRKLLLAEPSNAAFVRTPAGGLLLFMRQRTLMAQAFDAAKLQLAGEARTVAEQVRFSQVYDYGYFAVSENGLLAYLGGGLSQWTWLNRTGKRLTGIGEPADYGNWSSLSPDSKRLAVTRKNPTTGYDDIWLIDLDRGISSRFTFGSEKHASRYPMWSPDGKRIFFSADRDGVFDLYAKNANGSEKEKPLLESDLNKVPNDVSQDGRFLLYTEHDITRGASLSLLLLGGEPKPIPFPKGEGPEFDGVFSPDGKWVAYLSVETGKQELYVRRSPQSGAFLDSDRGAQRWQISNGGARTPVWRPDGKELLFKTLNSNIMAVALATVPAFQPGVPRLLFAPQFSDYGEYSNFLVTADGQQFLIQTPVDYESTPINVVVNWPRALKF
jgi:Tol biopolymer transport system component